MKKKRQTKQDKINAEKAALRRRVLDMAFGAFGWYAGAEDINGEWYKTRDILVRATIDRPNGVVRVIGGKLGLLEPIYIELFHLLFEPTTVTTPPKNTNKAESEKAEHRRRLRAALPAYRKASLALIPVLEGRSDALAGSPRKTGLIP